MKIKIPDVSPPTFNQLIRRPDAAAYKSIAAVSSLTVVVWMLFSSFDLGVFNGWLPYHVPVSIFLSLVLLVLALRSWVKMLISGETPASIAEEKPRQQPRPRRKPRLLKSMFRKPPRVLVVDDDSCVRMVLCKKLFSLGVRPVGVCDGLEALLAVADKPWDMVLMDGDMPYMDGIEATRHIRRQHLLPAGTPIVGITSNREWSYCQQCVSAGMNACRPKPRHTEDLEALLDEFLVMEDAVEAPILDGRITM
ncbi:MULTISPECIES: response regulator [Marinobacter]|uniref:response regulator n=1 Tax=Marinobacter TaxID=2742 RepID=UPI001248AAE4|nr:MULTISPECIES: response regulator [Marinobacter]MBL3556461.1 response regulator [Marinobacter sp. JB05H06]